MRQPGWDVEGGARQKMFGNHWSKGCAPSALLWLLAGPPRPTIVSRPPTPPAPSSPPLPPRPSYHAAQPAAQQGQKNWPHGSLMVKSTSRARDTLGGCVCNDGNVRFDGVFSKRFEIKREHLSIKSMFPVETQSALESADSAAHSKNQHGCLLH